MSHRGNRLARWLGGVLCVRHAVQDTPTRRKILLPHPPTSSPAVQNPTNKLQGGVWLVTDANDAPLPRGELCRDDVASRIAADPQSCCRVLRYTRCRFHGRRPA